MTALIALLVLLALVAVALERNHARQRYHRPTLAGSGTATDRDTERVVADLGSAHEDAPRPAVPARAIAVGHPVTR
jgi:hypothetical protein